MADLSLKPLTKLVGKSREKLSGMAGRIILRAGGVLIMALVLALNQTMETGPRLFLGALILSIVAALMMRAHLNTVDATDDERYRHEGVVWLTSIFAVAGVQVANLATAIEADSPVRFFFLAPVLAHAMLVSALATPGIGIVSLSMTAILLGVTGVLPPNVLITAWLSGAVATHVVNPLRQRSDLLRALTLLFGAQVVIAGSLAIIEGHAFPVMFEEMVWSALSAVIATALFWLGVALLEKFFDIVSDWTLLELCSPHQPPLNELQLRAPGTWAHSVGVANLAETAAREIGANALLCRTMAYYHDIGKSLRPSFFIENQVGSNVHDDLTPNLSAQVIAAHVTEGTELARKAKVPQIIIDGIEQHHGTSLISYFYHRAMTDPSLADLGTLSEEKFRYPGPKPQTKEVAILHLADIIEAATRAMPPNADVEEFIRGLVEKTTADGQLDEADLTFKEKEIITQAFCRSIRALRHDRVAYPKIPDDQEDDPEPQDHSAERTVS